MLPALSTNQKEREKIGAIARICANIGLFFVVAGIVPLTDILGQKFSSLQKGYFVFAIFTVSIMLIGQCVTLFGVKEISVKSGINQSTPLRELFGIIYRNNQLRDLFFQIRLQ
jgi:melibiose permease/lactose/raffinose/galactose permease